MADNTAGRSIIDENANDQTEEVIDNDKDSFSKSSLENNPSSSTSGEDFTENHTETITHPDSDALIDQPLVSIDPQNNSHSVMRKPDGADSDEESENEDTLELSDLDDEGRITLFERGLAYHKSGKQGLALKSYLTCLRDLSQECRFILLPQCLRNVADIYYAKEEYEKAVYFIQAEKLFYENALIDTRDLQARIDNDLSNNGESDLTNINPDALRAEEYEHLAKMCVDNGQSQLALEYAGKSTKLRQQIFGDGHDITRNSLDFFATVYADVGKQQYSESLEHLEEEVTDDLKPVADVENMNANVKKIDDDVETADEITPADVTSSPTSILKNRKSISDNNESVKKVMQQVRFDESVHDQSKEKEERITRLLLLMLFFVCFILLTILGVYIFCRMDRNSTTCSALRSEAHYIYMRFKYYFYHYMSTSKKKYT